MDNITITIPRDLATEFVGTWPDRGSDESTLDRISRLVKAALPAPITVTLDFEDARQFRDWLLHEVTWDDYECSDVLNRVDSAFEDAVYPDRLY